MVWMILSISWLNMRCESCCEKDEFHIADLVFSPLVSTEVVQQHGCMDSFSSELSIERLHCCCKNLTCHPCFLVVEVPETPLLATFLFEATWLLCVANEV